MNYSNVQFVSWQLDTSPIETAPNVGEYPGLWNFNDGFSKLDVVSQCYDIEARVEYLKKVINIAYDQVKSSNDDVLKIFIAPEFLFRGVAGAYVLDLLNGWGHAPEEFGIKGMRISENWPGLFGLMDMFLEDEKFKNWLFVIGSAIGASFPVNNGVIDTNSGEVYNCAYIKLGGYNDENSRHICRKHYMSDIDFLWHTYYITHNIDKVSHLLEDVDDQSLADGSKFQFDQIEVNNRRMKFGLEICLDHSMGVLRNAQSKVDIQLVPSCGMMLIDDKMVRKEDGLLYAINCDGHRFNPHTSIKDRDRNELQANEYGDIDLSHLSIDFHSAELPARVLWASGLGSLKISRTLPL